MNTSIYDFSCKDSSGAEVNLSDFRGKTLLIVNTASKCGFTPQFEALENLYKQNKKNIMVVGFPSNDFNQELTTDKEIQDFCKLTYAVEFPMMSKSSVVGPKANAVYKNLASITGEAPLWNFYKFLVMPNAESIHVFGSMTSPDSKKITNLLKPYIK